MNYQTIILIGPPGSGKSAVALILSDRLGYCPIDTDAEVVARAKMPIDVIFATLGEPYFRDLETSVVSDIVERRRTIHCGLVVSCGGGLPVREKNYQMLESIGTIVCLHATAEKLLARVLCGETRPLLQSESGEKTEARITSLLSQRATTYHRPRYRIDTTEISPSEVCDQIISLLSLV